MGDFHHLEGVDNLSLQGINNLSNEGVDNNRNQISCHLGPGLAAQRPRTANQNPRR